MSPVILRRVTWRHDPQLLHVDLAAMILRGRPAWHRHAACRGQGTGQWFPERGEPVDEALAVCDRCPVRAECAQAGVDGVEHGVWGGTTRAERVELRRGRRGRREAA